MTLAPVTRNQDITVMVLKRRVLQSLFDLDLATEIRQDPAVCVSLPSNSIVKEQTREHKFFQAANRQVFSRRQRPYR
jgi:hypothetical protein